ncbi:DUF922 domain-containing protein [Salaquimonas pukyongi]|uniref:DUF922 domain-containing protein n=1 Tax=Salaquimonas pukyongi TaxID=2712698 RepID=UPI0009FA6E41|nr:DUF922 domain-containing protein [Salaquimonas pukyongi]
MARRRIGTTICAVLGLMVGFCFSPGMAGDASAKVKVSVKTTYYPISGKSGKALNASMLRGGSNRISLSHAVAATETELDFGEPKISIKKGKCIVEDVDVYLKIRYIYPKWKGRGAAKTQVRKRWDAFWRELKRHEENHGEIAKAGAKALEKELMRMKGNVALGCADFGGFARLRLDAIIRKTARAQRNFDRREYAASSKISRLQRLLYEAR